MFPERSVPAIPTSLLWLSKKQKMKKNYSAPYVETIKLSTRSILMSSTDGSLGDLPETGVISDIPMLDFDMFNLL